jgi:hypothetical protein
VAVSSVSSRSRCRKRRCYCGFNANRRPDLEQRLGGGIKEQGDCCQLSKFEMLRAMVPRSSSAEDAQRLARSIWRAVQTFEGARVFTEEAWQAYVEKATSDDSTLVPGMETWNALVMASSAEKEEQAWLYDEKVRTKDEEDMVPFSPSAGEDVKKRKAVLRLARKLWNAMYCFLAPEDTPVFSVKAWLENVAKVCSKGAVAQEQQAAVTWNDVGMTCGGGSGAAAASCVAKVAEARGACKVP